MDASPRLLLSDLRTVFIGVPPAGTRLQAPAATLILALEGSVAQGQGCWLLPPQSLLAQPPAAGPLLVCFLDVMGVDLALLKPQFVHQDSTGWSHWPAVEPLRASARHWLEAPVPASRLFTELDVHLTPASAAPHDLRLDDRVVHVVERIKEDISLNLSLAHLAQSVGLSEAHLAHCFREQTGVAIRRYRLWHRLYHTAVAIQQGQTLTHAAQDAGFNDSAHFSHTFQRFFGFPPSSLFTPQGGLQIEVLQSPYTRPLSMQPGKNAPQ
ncbi:MAG: AraC family transcriptional regulator [Marinobacter sp.]|nr:AraC family transcriptional regulator [Marinobacter sp.]